MNKKDETNKLRIDQIKTQVLNNLNSVDKDSSFNFLSIPNRDNEFKKLYLGEFLAVEPPQEIKLKSVPLPQQKDILDSPETIKLIGKNRRVGFDYLSFFEIVKSIAADEDVLYVCSNRKICGVVFKNLIDFLRYNEINIKQASIHEGRILVAGSGNTVVIRFTETTRLEPLIGFRPEKIIFNEPTLGDHRGSHFRSLYHFAPYTTKTKIVSANYEHEYFYRTGRAKRFYLSESAYEEINKLKTYDQPETYRTDREQF